MLFQVQFNTTLSGLSFVMLVGIFGLGLTVTSKTGDSTSDRSTDTITDSLTQVRELTLSFLALTLEILFSALLLEILIA